VTFDYDVLVVGPGFGGSVTALRASVQAGRAGGAPAALQLPLVEIR
jgi:flavin-dependent dehydrogenase